MFASFFFEAVNFVGRLHSQFIRLVTYVMQDYATSSKNFKMGRILEWLATDDMLPHFVILQDITLDMSLVDIKS